MRNNNNLFRIFSLITIVIFIIGCYDEDNNNNKDGAFIKKYLLLITDYRNEDLTSSQKKEIEYKEHIHIPNRIIKLTKNCTKIADLYMTVDSLGPSSLNPYDFLYFPQLGWIFKNGDLWFSGGATITNNVSSLYNIATKTLKKYSTSFEGLPFDFKIRNNDGTRLWYNGSSTNLFCTDLLIILKDKESSYEIEIIKKDVNSEKQIQAIILPATGSFSTNSIPMGFGNQLDSNGRIYLFINFNKIKSYLKRKDIREFTTELQVLIFDINNDTLYQLYHPITDDNNKDEKVEAFTYCLGEDGNIYYQLVTDKAYYIYKITPLWDEPMEETEYNPIFFEFHPELKAEWDRLTAQEETKAVNQ